MLGNARFLTYAPAARVPFAEPYDASWSGIFSDTLWKNRAAVENYHEELVYVPTTKLSARRRRALLEAVGRLPDVQIARVDGCMPFFIEDLLEAGCCDRESFLPEERDVLFADLLKRSRNLSMSSFFFDTGRYICPLAESSHCAAATDKCLAGIVRGNEFPPSHQCYVREGLKSSYFFEIDHL